MSKLKGAYILFGPYEYWRVCKLASEHYMSVCEYIHWLLSFEIKADEEADYQDDLEYYRTHHECAYEE